MTIKLDFMHKLFNILIKTSLECYVFISFVKLFKKIKENGHKEDIVSIAKSDSNFLATSSYDGEVIIWNMISGHIFSKLISPRPASYKDENCMH
jgi:WD40 repeat protein